MEILLADTWGMCKGLRLIMHRTHQTLRQRSEEQVFIYRSLVHNEQAHKELFDMGVQGIVKNVQEIPLGATVIVGPHSASAIELKHLKDRAVLIDTSCRDVIRVLDAARQHHATGHCIVFVGLSNHEEAISILTEFPDTLIVSNESDVVKVPRDAPLALISQSTGTKELFDKIANLLKEDASNVTVDCTVCNETHVRQVAAAKLVEKCDTVIVVGGKKSHNTNELANTCRRAAKVHLIETADELQIDWFNHETVVGVTAGASTPDNIVAEVVQRLNEIATLLEGQQRHRLQNKLRWFFAYTKIKFIDTTLLIFQRASILIKFK